MRRSVIRRLVVVVSAAVLATMTAAACAVPGPKPTVTWHYADDLFDPPNPGAAAGTSPGFLYQTSHLPAGSSTFLQKAGLSGGTVQWRTLSQLEDGPAGTGRIIRPPLGRNVYRVAVFAKGKLLTSAIHGLDVYGVFSFQQITTRDAQSVKLPGGDPFVYVFQSVILLQHTSCRSISNLVLANKGTQTRQVEISHTVGNKTTSSLINVPPTVGNALTKVFVTTEGRATPGEDLQIQVLNNATLGSTVYGNGYARCFTDTGRF